MSDLVERTGNKLLDRIMSRLAAVHLHGKFRRVSRIMAISAAVIVIFDLHRYGAWYTGGATYWKSWAYIVLPVLILPGAIYVMAIITAKGYIRLIRAVTGGILAGVVVIIVGLNGLLDKQFPDPGYIDGYVRSDFYFWLIFGYSLFWALLAGAIIYLSSTPEE